MAAANEVDFPSGTWTGYYQLEGRKVKQDLELTFDAGVVRGGGWDRHGEFRIKGSYDPDSREVRWTKVYDRHDKVTCRGFREGRGIWGTWERAGASGGFHVWPLAGA